jgi:hypothetical protein
LRAVVFRLLAPPARLLPLERALELEPLPLARFRVPLFFLARRFGAGGTLPPFSRASLKPIAIACFRLRTLPPEPLRSVPFF